jgi:O6-methylguanine-DNA--protein-cysteine methyltransferase
MSYWELPEDIFENYDELNIWIEKSLAIKPSAKSSRKSKKDMEIDKNILESLLKIPKGQVTTYKILADKF